MKINVLPAAQGRLNDRIIEKLRGVGYVLLFLGLVGLAEGARMYLWPPPMPSGPEVYSSDGATLLGDAILIGPDLALCACKVSDSAEFVSHGERITAKKINSAAITDVTQITLLRLQRNSSLPALVPSVAELNDDVVAVAGGQEWQGSVRTVKPGAYETEPEFNLPSGVPIVRQADRTALIGIACQSQNSVVVVPVKDVLAKFPELGRLQ